MLGHAATRTMCFNHLLVRSAPIILNAAENRIFTFSTRTTSLLLNKNYNSASSYSSCCSIGLLSTNTTTTTTSGTNTTVDTPWRISPPHCHYHHYTQQYRRYKSSTKLECIHKRLFHTTGVDNMRFVQFLKTSNGTQIRGLGVELPTTGEIVDLTAADPTIPTDMKTFLEGSRTHLVKASRASGSGKHRIKKDDVQLLAPITQPDKLICIGMNYKDHCEEQNVKVPAEPVIFSKFSSCIIGPNDDIPYPEETQELDWEVELAFVIGKEGKKISAEDAMSHVFGYTVAHDVSARDWQMKKNGRQWLLGKTMDGFCPLGPCIVMKEDIINPEKLGIRCSVNGVLKQDSNTSNLVHGIQKLVVYLSRFITLKPGDVVITGTPPGVGVFRKPPEFLKKGDVVKCEIDDIGSITNKIA